MNKRIRVSRAQLKDTFVKLRRCGDAERECQVLWVSPWSDPTRIMDVVHPAHAATAVSFDLDGEWLSNFWRKLAIEEGGVRVQVHTHPGHAFHSETDDEWPLIQTTGFLSLVIPRFARGEIGFQGTYLAELCDDGSWSRVAVEDCIEVLP